MTKLIGSTYAQEVAYVSAAQYLGGESLALNAASAAATLPAGVTMVLIGAEAGPVYYAVNDAGGADADSPGYVPKDAQGFVYPCANLNTLHVYGAVGTKAHLQYFQES